MNVKVLHDEQAIRTSIGELGAAIRRDAGEGEILIIGVLKRTTMFLADLVRQIPGSVRYEFIDVLTEVSDTETADALSINFLTHFQIQGQRVYLLKDIVSSGAIETYLLSQLRQKEPADLKLVAMLDRPGMRTTPLDVDYALFSVGEGTYVGYGLEYENQYGNLPYIGTV